MDDVDSRVKEILELIRAGEWDQHRLVALAGEHGVKLSAAREWQTQAFRVLRFLRGTSEEYRERLLADLDFAASLARNAERTYVTKDGEERSYRAPDVNALIKARAEQAKLVLLQERDGDEELSETELDALIRARGYRKDTDATERATEAAAERAATDRQGERGEAKGREEGFRAEDDAEE